MNAQRYIGMRASLSWRNLLPGKFIGGAVKLNSSRSFTFPVWEPFWHREMNYLVEGIVTEPVPSIPAGVASRPLFGLEVRCDFCLTTLPLLFGFSGQR